MTNHAPDSNTTHCYCGTQQQDVVVVSLPGCPAVDELKRGHGTYETDEVTEDNDARIELDGDNMADMLNEAISSGDVHGGQ